MFSHSQELVYTTIYWKKKEEKQNEVEKSFVNGLIGSGVTEARFRSEIIEDPSSTVEWIIINYAERESVDLIVMGTRGKSGFKRPLLGSVASGVLSYAHCPVMILR